MNFKNLQTIACPHCGCTLVVREELKTCHLSGEILVHCNGKRWEKRRFECGFEVEYVPKFERGVEKKGSCTKTKAHQKKAKQIEKFEDQIGELERQLRAVRGW